MKILVALLALALLVCILTRPSGPVTDSGRDRHADSAKAVHRADSTALALADSTLARDARDSSVRTLADSADALGHRLDSLDRLATRWKRVARLRGDSLVAVRLEPGAGIPGDTLALSAATEELSADSSLSCEARYGGRLRQLGLLGRALEGCRARGDTLRAVLVRVRDSFELSAHYLVASDSLLRWERDRPRPCRINLVLAHVGCGATMGGIGVLGFVLGMVAR